MMFGILIIIFVIKFLLFDFVVLFEYIIFRELFCNRYIIVIDLDNKYFIFGFFVFILDFWYYCNEFIFNFGFVVDYDVD